MIPLAPSTRALWDAAATEILAGINEPDERGRPPDPLYGSLTMRDYLRRQGIPVAKGMVERLVHLVACAGR